MEYIREQRKVFIPKQVSWFYGVPKINNGKILNFDFMPNISWMISVNCKDAIEFLIQCKKKNDTLVHVCCIWICLKRMGKWINFDVCLCMPSFRIQMYRHLRLIHVPDYNSWADLLRFDRLIQPIHPKESGKSKCAACKNEMWMNDVTCEIFKYPSALFRTEMNFNLNKFNFGRFFLWQFI